MTGADDDRRHVLEHYATAVERERLDTPLGTVEFERTKEELTARLPPPPATVADIGGGPGRYAFWLAEAGYRVIHRDIVPAHVQQLSEQISSSSLDLDSGVADARELDVSDASVDAVLLLGPLYHLTQRSERLRAFAEARRILRPGGVAFVAAISRWTPRLHAEVVERMYRELDVLRDELERLERTGRMPPLRPQGFAGYCHRPAQLRREIADAGLEVIDLQALEGIAFALPDLEERLASPVDRDVVLRAARDLARVPELLGLGPHLLAVGRRSADRRGGGAVAPTPRYDEVRRR